MLQFRSPQSVATSWSKAVWDSFLALRSKKFIRNVGVMSSGSALGHAFTLAAGPILTRIYGPEEFGALGLFTTLISTLGVAITLQYEISIVVGRDESEAAYLTFGSLLFAVPVSTLAGILLWLLIRTSTLGFGSLPWFTPPLLAISMAFIGFFTALRYWSLRAGQFGKIAQGTFVQSAGRSIFQTMIGAVGFHSSGLLVGETLGRCIGMSSMIRSSWPVLKRNARQFRLDEFGRVLWRYRKFPMYSFPSSFLDALCLALPLPLLIRMYGVSLGGYYSLVWKAITVPGLVITVAIADTFHGSLAKCARDTPDRVMHLFRLTSLGLLVTGGIPAVILWFWGQPLFEFVFGVRWALSGAIASIVAPWYLAQFVVSPLSRAAVVLSGQEMKLLWDVLCLVSLVAVFCVAHSRGLASLQTIRLLSWAYTLLLFAYYLVLVHIVGRFIKSRNATTQVT